MNNKRNYYRILHVQPDAPLEIIQSSYRTLMQKLKQHPDLGGEHWNASIINEAYGVLTDPEKRKAYDQALFKDKKLNKVAQQHSGQRDPTGTFKPFKPKVVKE